MHIAHAIDFDFNYQKWNFTGIFNLVCVHLRGVGAAVLFFGIFQ